MIQSPFKLDGTYKHLRDPLESNVHDLLDLNDRFLPDDATLPSWFMPVRSIVKRALLN
jgi:hypothetical protein